MLIAISNVRELENMVHRELLVTPGYPITLRDVRRVMNTSVGRETENNRSISTLIKEHLGSAANEESTEVYAELIGTLEGELFKEAIKPYLRESEQSNLRGLRDIE